MNARKIISLLDQWTMPNELMNNIYKNIVTVQFKLNIEEDDF